MGGRSKLRAAWTVPEFITDPDDTLRQRWAVEVLDAYFHARREDGTPAYTGAMFERLAGGGDRDEVADRFVGEDLVAVTMLSVDVDAQAAIRILYTDADALSELLSEIPRDRDLVDAGDEHIGVGTSPADRLWRHLSGYHGLGETTISKLLARKRPRLLPVIDSVVRDVLSISWSGDYWCEMRGLLQAEQRWRFLHQARAAAQLADEVSVLRCFDVLVWMSGRSGCPSPTWDR